VLIASQESGLCVGDLVAIVPECKYSTFDDFTYSVGIVIGLCDCNLDNGDLDFHDLFGLKYHERRFFPSRMIAKFNGSNDQIKKIRFEIFEEITNLHVDNLVPDLSIQLFNILSLLSFVG